MPCTMENVAFVDALYTWRVPLASALANALAFGFAKSAGLVVIGMQEEDWQLTPNTILITIALNITLMGLLSPLVNVLCQKLSSRLVATTGVLICFSSLFLASLWLNSTTFLLLIGLTLSSGFALCFSPPLLLNGICFERYRTRAAGVCFAGESLGCTVLPFLLTFLIDRYTVRGALMILSAIFLHLIAFTVILPTIVIAKKTNQILVKQSVTCPGSCRASNGGNEQPETSSLMPQARRHRCRLFEGPCPNPLYALLAYTLSMMLVSFGYFNQVTIYPLLSNANGISRDNLSWVIATHGFVEFLSRLLFGVIGEKLTGSNKTWVFALFVGLLGAFAQIISYFPGNLTVLVIYVVSLGLSGGWSGAMWTVILASLVGVANFPRGLTYVLLTMSSFCLILLCCMGFVREAIGSYEWVIRMGGFSAFVAMLILLLVVFTTMKRTESRNLSAPANLQMNDEKTLEMLDSRDSE